MKQFYSSNTIRTRDTVVLQSDPNSLPSLKHIPPTLLPIPDSSLTTPKPCSPVLPDCLQHMRYSIDSGIDFFPSIAIMLAHGYLVRALWRCRPADRACGDPVRGEQKEHMHKVLNFVTLALAVVISRRFDLILV